jgi:hypothetical protein
MAKRLLPPDWHVTRDNGDPATDATILVRIAGTSTPTPAYSDKELATSLGSTINCDATGYPASGGNDVALWGADTISYDLIVQATGYNGGASKTLEDVAVADDAVADEASSALALGNAFDNGGFEAWSFGTSFSNVSGDGDGDQVADGWYLSQSTAAGNAVSRQPGFEVDGLAASRYCLRVGRPAASTNFNDIRLWKILRPEIARRLRGKECTLRYSIRKGADFQASSGGRVFIQLASGDTESEDGDLIHLASFSGQVNDISTFVTPEITGQRFEHTFIFADNIREVGLQFRFSPGGTAGANDYIEIQDVELKLSSDPEEFHARPEILDFLLSNLSTGGRLFNSTAFTDPGADRVMIWDESANDFVGATLGTGLAITGTAFELSAPMAAIAGLAVTDSNVIVGNGSTWVAESGATARTSLGVGTGDSPSFTGLTLSGQLSLANGLVSAPSWCFTNDPDNGAFYYGSANLWALVAGGVSVMDCFTTYVQSRIRHIFPNGSVGSVAVGLGGASLTGFYTIGTNNPGASANGALVWQWDATAPKDASGNVWQVGGKHALPLPASAWRAQTTNGAAFYSAELTTNRQMINGWAFDAATDEFIQCEIPMPKSWNEGTFTARIRWYAPSGSGNVVWGVQALCVGDDDAIDTAWGTAQTVTDTLTATGDMMVTAETSAITAAGSPAEADTLWVRVYRDADNGSDTFSADAILLSVELFPSISGSNDA